MSTMSTMSTASPVTETMLSAPDLLEHILASLSIRGLLLIAPGPRMGTLYDLVLHFIDRRVLSFRICWKLTCTADADIALDVMCAIQSVGVRPSPLHKRFYTEGMYGERSKHIKLEFEKWTR
ncbi:hypothetical protein C8R47DRAFT_1205460 [Mycena vitilis]|nr:hypothetical protein C8R47DRAFT_1205460 [Mycena vitilis]